MIERPTHQDYDMQGSSENVSSSETGVRINQIELDYANIPLTPTTFTTQDLEAARAELSKLGDSYADDTSNNPNKYRSDIRSAFERVHAIEGQLKAAGLIERTEKEKIETILDAMHPHAQSKLIVEYNGQKYQRRYTPMTRSNSGKSVRTWNGSWQLVEEN